VGSRTAFDPNECSEVLSAAAPFTKVHDPDMAAHEVYTAMLPRYEALEKECLKH
jgi:hypothetical protein